MAINPVVLKNSGLGQFSNDKKGSFMCKINSNIKNPIITSRKPYPSKNTTILCVKRKKLSPALHELLFCEYLPINQDILINTLIRTQYNGSGEVVTISFFSGEGISIQNFRSLNFKSNSLIKIEGNLKSMGGIN